MTLGNYGGGGGPPELAGTKGGKDPPESIDIGPLIGPEGTAGNVGGAGGGNTLTVGIIGGAGGAPGPGGAGGRDPVLFHPYASHSCLEFSRKGVWESLYFQVSFKHKANSFIVSWGRAFLERGY